MSTRASAGGGLGGVFGVLLLIGLVIKFIWWILGAAALVGLYFLGRAISRGYGRRQAEYACHRDALAARAEQQHNWVLRGDDRGIYGPEGAELMQYVFPAQHQIRRRIRPG